MGAIRTWITIGIGSLARKGVKKLQLPIGVISRIEMTIMAEVYHEKNYFEITLWTCDGVSAMTEALQLIKLTYNVGLVLAILKLILEF